MACISHLLKNKTSLDKNCEKFLSSPCFSQSFALPQLRTTFMNATLPLAIWLSEQANPAATRLTCLVNDLEQQNKANIFISCLFPKRFLTLLCILIGR